VKPQLLIIDDNKEFVNDFILILEKDFNCSSAYNGKDGLTLILHESPDIVLLDLMLGDNTNGLQILKQIRNEDEDLPVIMITDYASVDTAVEAMRFGAFDYISKTPNLKELKFVIEKALQQRINSSRTKSFEEETIKHYAKMLGNSSAMQKLKETITLFATNNNTVLITGESGVGKELVARQIHLQSDRKKKPFVAINCAAIPRELLESELFGHERGAFTGANARKLGKFELAMDGVLFLDEIAELDLTAQVKLLRVLQEKEFDRVGGTVSIKTQARIIAATNKNLTTLVKEGKFREDLFYRLNVLPIRVPPLRERKEDIEELSLHFAKTGSIEMKVHFKGFDEDAINMLQDYDYPGNIRELQNFIIRAVLLAKGDFIKPDHLFHHNINESPDIKSIKIPDTWEEMDELRRITSDNASRMIEKLFIEKLLKKFNGNVSQAAVHIGINRTNLHKMIKKCDIKINE
jgi:two-component system, NtrC family, response regulator AtoC